METPPKVIYFPVPGDYVCDMRIIAAFLSLLTLAACAAPVPGNAPVMVAPGVTLALPAPADLGRSIDAMQMVSARHGAEIWVFEGRLSVRPDEVRLACLDGMGRRALTVAWTGARLEVERAPWVPDTLRAENILADIVLLYWPEQVVRQSLHGAALHQDGSRRDIGDAVAISWAGDPWNGSARLHNAAWDYELNVQSATVGP